MNLILKLENKCREYTLTCQGKPSGVYIVQGGYAFSVYSWAKLFFKNNKRNLCITISSVPRVSFFSDSFSKFFCNSDFLLFLQITTLPIILVDCLTSLDLGFCPITVIFLACSPYMLPLSIAGIFLSPTVSSVPPKALKSPINPYLIQKNSSKGLFNLAIYIYA